MFVACPTTIDLCDAEWYDELADAKQNALDWSVERHGENVIVYEATELDDGELKFNKLYSISA